MLGLSGEKGRKFMLGSAGVLLVLCLLLVSALLKQYAGIDMTTEFKWAVTVIGGLLSTAIGGIAYDDAHTKPKP